MSLDNIPWENADINGRQHVNMQLTEINATLHLSCLKIIAITWGRTWATQYYKFLWMLGRWARKAWKRFNTKLKISGFTSHWHACSPIRSSFYYSTILYLTTNFSTRWSSLSTVGKRKILWPLSRTSKVFCSPKSVSPSYQRNKVALTNNLLELLGAWFTVSCSKFGERIFTP
jgi:hypothetical protein